MVKRLAAYQTQNLVSPYCRSHSSIQMSLYSLCISLWSAHAHKGTHTLSHPESWVSLLCLPSVFFCIITHKQTLILLWTSWKNPVKISPSHPICLISAQRRMCWKCAVSTAPETESHKQTIHIPLNGINVFSYKSCWCLSAPCLHKPYIKNSAGTLETIWGLFEVPGFGLVLLLANENNGCHGHIT